MKTVAGKRRDIAAPVVEKNSVLTNKNLNSISLSKTNEVDLNSRNSNITNAIAQLNTAYQHVFGGIFYGNHKFVPLEPKSAITFERYCGPTAESNWILPGILLVGAYPATNDDNETFELLSSILYLGITKFVCLQREYRDGIPEHVWRANKALRPYYNDVKLLISNKDSIEAYQQPYLDLVTIEDNHLCYDSSHPIQKNSKLNISNNDHNRYQRIVDYEHLSFVHFPIEDCNVVQDNYVLQLAQKLVYDIGTKGDVCYVHCWGGHGRTGTVVCLMLHLMYGLSASECMARCQLVHDLRRYPVVVQSPQTEQQREQVRRIIGALESHYVEYKMKLQMIYNQQKQREEEVLMKQDVIKNISNTDKALDEKDRKEKVMLSPKCKQIKNKNMENRMADDKHHVTPFAAKENCNIASCMDEILSLSSGSTHACSESPEDTLTVTMDTIDSCEVSSDPDVDLTAHASIDKTEREASQAADTNASTSATNHKDGIISDSTSLDSIKPIDVVISKKSDISTNGHMSNSTTTAHAYRSDLMVHGNSKGEHTISSATTVNISNCKREDDIASRTISDGNMNLCVTNSCNQSTEENHSVNINLQTPVGPSTSKPSRIPMRFNRNTNPIGISTVSPAPPVSDVVIERVYDNTNNTKSTDIHVLGSNTGTNLIPNTGTNLIPSAPSHAMNSHAHAMAMHDDTGTKATTIDDLIKLGNVKQDEVRDGESTLNGTEVHGNNEAMPSTTVNEANTLKGGLRQFRKHMKSTHDSHPSVNLASSLSKPVTPNATSSHYVLSTTSGITRSFHDVKLDSKEYKPSTTQHQLQYDLSHPEDGIGLEKSDTSLDSKIVTHKVNPHVSLSLKINENGSCIKNKNCSQASIMSPVIVQKTKIPRK